MACEVGDSRSTCIIAQGALGTGLEHARVGQHVSRSVSLRVPIVVVEAVSGSVVVLPNVRARRDGL